jgi:LuxR family maltose regulon positive regulatory protein
MEAWLGALPRQVAQVRPHLAIMRTWMALDDGAVAWAERCLEAIEQVLQEEPEGTRPADRDRDIEGEIAAARALVATTRRDPSQAIAHAEQALECLDRDNEVIRGVVAMTLGTAYAEQHDLGKAARVLGEARTTFYSLDNKHLGLRVMLFQSYVQRAQGCVHLAATTCQEALAWTGDYSSPMVGLIHVQLADLLRESNDLDAAFQHATRGIARSAPLENPELQVFPPLVLARVKQARGDLDGALEVMRQAEEFAHDGEGTWFLPLLEAFEAQIRLMQGNVTAATRLAQKAAQRTKAPFLDVHPLFVRIHASGVYAFEHIKIAPIQLMIAQGRASGDPGPLETALAVLEQHQEHAERAGLAWYRIKLLALRALAHHGLGDAGRALAALEEALTLAQPEGYVRLFADEGKPMAELLRQVDAPGIAADYLQHIVDCAAAAGRTHRSDSPQVVLRAS